MPHYRLKSRQGGIGNVVVFLFCFTIILWSIFWFFVESPKLFNPNQDTNSMSEDSDNRLVIEKSISKESNYESNINGDKISANLPDAIDYLKTNNCTLVRKSSLIEFGGNKLNEIDYNEFMNVSLNKNEIILYYEENYGSDIIIIPHKNKLYALYPEEKIRIRDEKYLYLSKIDITSTDCQKNLMDGKLE